MPEFGSFGILSAVELLGEFGDERAGPTLIALLDSEDHVVREWAAGALGELRINDAIDPLKLAYERVKARRTPLHWTEPLAIRNALTRLGAREEIIPPSVARLRLQRMGPNPRHYWERSWEREHVAEVIDALADAGQAIVTVIAWAAGGGAHIPTQMGTRLVSAMVGAGRAGAARCKGGRHGPRCSARCGRDAELDERE
jgi:hypothetical protein